MSAVSIWRRFAVLGLLCCAVLLALLSGPAEVGLADLRQLALGGGSDVARTVVFELRLPRALAAYAVGALLALSGLLLQALFRNPLADPYVLGVSGGAAAAVALVWLVGSGGGATRLLLTGVVIGAACGAVVTLILALSSAEALRGMLFWLAGDLSGASQPLPPLALALAGTAAATALARPLDALAAGELRAQSIGLDLPRARRAVVAGSALLAGAAVVTTGVIGFVGLLGPHAARLLLRSSSHRMVAPAAALLGGLLVAVADTLARTVLEPRQLPLGALLALIGAPVFLSLLRRAGR